MFCPKCGSAVQDNAQFCVKCSAALPGAAAPPATGDSKANPLALLSLVIPGVGQFANRHFGKGVLMLIGGAILALTVHPLGWFGAGLWSAFEAHQSATKPTSNSSGGFNASKFATISFVLVICFVVLYNTFTGVTLESLDLAGLGKIKFSSRQNVVSEKEVEGMNTEVRTQREQEEISMIYGVPTTTAAGQGRLTGRTLELDCNTIMEIPGHLRLQLSPDGRTLSGSFTYINGASIPMTLYR